MKEKIIFFIVTGVSVFFLSFAFGDKLSDALNEKLEIYRRENQPAILYTHIDRNNYMPGDTIWFKSYQLSGMKSDVLYLRITDDNRKVVMQQQFPVYDIRAHGEVALSDTLPDGKYFLHAYTDRMINFDPEEVFVQPITISSNISERVDMEMFATNADKIERGKEVKVGLRVKDKNMAVKGAMGYYSIWVGNERLKSREIGTNRQGEAYIDFTYPKIADSQSVRFKARLDGDRQYASLSLNLKHDGNSLKVNVYPEGGPLLNGVVNNTVFEVLDANKNPVTTSLTLNEGNRKIATIETNKQGVGKIRFKPDKNFKYTITYKEYGTLKTTSLPNVAQEGYGLKLETDKDQYSAIIHNLGKPENPTLVVRAFSKVLWTGKPMVRKGDSVRVALPVHDFPKDVLSLAIFEPSGTPGAERLFVNKPNDTEYIVQIDTVKISHARYNKIKVILRVTDKNGNPVNTNLSVAVTEKSMLSTSDYRTIGNAVTFHHLSNAAVLAAQESDADLDMLMISKNWGRYNWQQILSYQPKNRINILTNTSGINGIITKISKKTLKPLSIYLWSKSGIEPVDVMENGYFSIPPEQLMVNQFEAKYLILGADFYENYQIKLLDHAVEYDEKVKAGAALYWPQQFNTIARYDPPLVKTAGRGIQLKEVKISALGSVSIHGRKCSNECGDYVCIYKVLNCPIHNCGETPKVGLVYRYPYSHNVVYNGCNKVPTRAPEGSVPGGLPAPSTSLRLQAISYPRSFFVPDYSNPVTEPDNRPTIYWEPNLYTNTESKTTFEFGTSGIKQEYIIVVQGIEVNTLRPVYHTQTLKL